MSNAINALIEACKHANKIALREFGMGLIDLNVITAAEAPAVPDGWQLVPTAITLEMRKAAGEYDRATFDPTWAGTWEAMLAAAPKPAQQPPSVIEEIAQQWDGCIYDSPSGDIDIGWAIRAAGKRLVSEQQPKEGGE